MIIFSLKRSAIAAVIFFASFVFCYGSEYPLYRVDFGSPPHTLGTLPASGSITTPSDRVSSVRFGYPTVVSSFVALSDQPLELRGNGVSPFYSQIEFTFGRQSDFVVFESDLCVQPEAGPAHSGLTFFFDTPQVRTVTFNRSGLIETYIPGLVRIIGQYSFNQKVRFRAELNLGTHRWRLFVNGALLEDANFDAAELDAVRISLDNAAVQNPAVGIDNINITAYEGRPSVIEEPRSQIVAEGATVTFNVVASGDRASGDFGLRYQWSHNGVPIAGATAQNLVINGATSADAGAYAVAVSNNYGSTTSATATLTVDDAPAHLQNISTRLDVQSGDNALIGGFIVQGTGAKKVIIRAIGPSLNVNGVPLGGRLNDPVLQLYNSAGTLIATNDNWRDTQAQEIIASTVPPLNDLEAALTASLQPGSYTAIVRGANNSTGVALVEVYELDAGAAVKIVNVSTRGFVRTGDKVMIGGFILGGAKPATLLVRAIGPSLNNNGVPLAATLQDPSLELHNSEGDLIGQNNDWREAQQAEISATGVQPGNDREAALVITLAPGNYTAIVRGADSGTGLASVEIYHLGR